MRENSSATSDLDVGYRTRTDGWSVWQHAVLAVFYITTLLGFVSFLAFNFWVLKDLLSDRVSLPPDLRAWAAIILSFCFFASLQIIWGFAVWKIHLLDKPLKLAALAILPLFFISVPFGVIGYIELTRVPPPSPPVDY